MFNLGQYMEMTAPGSGVAEGLAVNDVREMEELSSQDLYETFDVHETEMIRDIQECIENNPDLKIDQWQELDIDEKERVLQNLEAKIAQIEGRVPCEVRIEHMEGKHGYAIPARGLIVISSSDASVETISGLREVVDTVVHEGRHAYQYQNVYGVRTEMNDAKYNGWVSNYASGYLTAEEYGMKAYLSQPLEADAWAFAERTVSQISFR